MTFNRFNRKKNRNERRGIVLYIVVIVVAVLSLGGITLLALMKTEYEATVVRTQELQLSNVARSAVVLMESMLELTPEERNQFGGIYDNPPFFCNVSVLPNELGGKGNANFTILSPKFDDDKITGVRYGLVDESSRLNLAAVLQWDEETPGTGRRSLMKLPGMTATMADSILDWIDSDEQARSRGAEASFYSKKSLPYSPRNAVPVFLEELLLVRDVTRLQLYGTDEAFNFNDVAESGQNATGESASDAASLYLNPAADSEESAISGYLSTSNASSGNSTANSTGGLSNDAIPNETIVESPNVYKVGDVPWIQYLTVFSAEKDVDPTGEARIDLNGSDLAFLYDELSKYLDEKTAEFVVLYRQFGPATSEQIQSTTVSPNAAAAGDDSALDFSIPAKFRLETPLDIVGASVIVPLASSETPNAAATTSTGRTPGATGTTGTTGQNQSGTVAKTEAARIVESPIPAKRSVGEDLFKYLDYVSTNSSTVIVGRVNVNEASRTVLETVPNLTANDVQRILSSRPSPQEANSANYRHPAWLYTEGIVNLAKMKKLWNKTTSRGDVYRGQIVSFLENRGANKRGEVVIDNTVSPPRQVFYKDLTPYGQGYPNDILLGTQTTNAATDDLTRLMQESGYSSSAFPDVDFSTNSFAPLEIVPENNFPSVAGSETPSNSSASVPDSNAPTTETATKPLSKRQQLLESLKEMRLSQSKSGSGETSETAPTKETGATKETESANAGGSPNASASKTTTPTTSRPSTTNNSSKNTAASNGSTTNSASGSPTSPEPSSPLTRRQKLLQTLREQRQNSPTPQAE